MTGTPASLRFAILAASRKHPNFSRAWIAVMDLPFCSSARIDSVWLGVFILVIGKIQGEHIPDCQYRVYCKNNAVESGDMVRGETGERDLPDDYEREDWFHGICWLQTMMNKDDCRHYSGEDRGGDFHGFQRLRVFRNASARWAAVA